jgi:hypothetical protein
VEREPFNDDAMQSAKMTATQPHPVETTLFSPHWPSQFQWNLHGTAGELLELQMMKVENNTKT